MIELFKEGGWAMYPVLVVGVILVWSAVRYAIDREPARRPFITVLSQAYVAIMVQGVVTDVATVFWALSGGHAFPDGIDRGQILLVGLKESTRPAVLGLGLLALALVAVSVGAYRNSLRELPGCAGIDRLNGS